MTKTEFLDRFSKSADERLLLSRVLDKAERCRTRSVPEYTGFLSPAEQAMVQDALRFYGDVRFVFRGGFEGAERNICFFLPEWMDEEYLTPDTEETITAVSADISRANGISHRDVLGSLMGIGLTREKLGDILIADGAAQCVLLKSAADIILSQWEGIGRYNISSKEIALSELSVKPPQLKHITDTVATLRLDAVMSSGFSLSRTKASEYISAGRVAVNHRDCLKGDKSVAEGDIITCRGLGKCILREVSGTSKKGRTIIKMDRYI